jgi:glycosyltransferase involved in cell wall biosynthesis
VVVLTQDPRYRGGVLTQLEAFVAGSERIGRSPSPVYLARPNLASRSAPTSLAGTAVHTSLHAVDALHQLVGARLELPYVRAARTRWVCSTTASHGYAAVLAGTPFGCWIGTAADDEWRARRQGLGAGRRLALAVNARPLRRLERRVLRGASVLCATSRSARDGIARAAGLDPERIRILPVPIDIERFRPLDDERWAEAAATRPVVAFVGRASDPRKNIALLIEAAELLRTRLPEARVRLVGEPPGVDVPPNVEVTGPVEDVAGELAQATVFVLPSRQEGFGIVAAEAMACGVPVVSTRSGGPEELVAGSGGGVLLDTFEPAELADTIEGLLGDVDTLNRMRSLGRAHVVQEHGPACFDARLAAAYAELDAL